MDGKTENQNPPDEGLSRRDFLKLSKQVFIGAGVCGMLPGIIMINDAVAAMPVSGGYILVDLKKCQGCMTCMLTCSLAHEGAESLSLSRIQIVQDAFGKFPNDLGIAQCRQCVEPACVNACPSDALFANPRYGNIRMVDAEKCTGCKSCIEACPYSPGRAVWDAENKKARLCDLCAETPYWNQKGGIGGKQACVEICPVGALEFTNKIPVQEGEKGYQTNLRGETWKKLGYPVD
ncbi:MAG: 4Fe-4S dicluster domain-containing protein [Desulfobacterales bacterium]|nr:4Fe-4S dicluster domain-containing protein [Desulfobacterales bacterium]